MAKKMRFSSRYSKHKLGDKREIFQADRISQLPDEIIVSILSLLTIREATRTCVLSHRWERLWTLFNGSLNFDLMESPFAELIEYREQERSNYIEWVNQVLTSLDGSSSSNIKDFIVGFDSDEDSRCHIDRWVVFALERRVQRLELDMKPLECPFTKAFRQYTFSLDFCARIKQPCGLYSISALTSLCLKFVDITGELIEYFLSNCPLLERLSVADSNQLSNLKVTGASTLQLKHLEIYRCFSLEILEISAPNLLSFNYIGSRIKLRVENVPQLVAIFIAGYGMVNLVDSLSSYFSQLETLNLESIRTEVPKNFPQHIDLAKLKHLILRVFARKDDCLLGWTTLIKASPLLHRFTLELLMFRPRYRRKMPKVIECPHQCLKVVEVVGFVGCSTDEELVMYLHAYSSALEKIIINCRDPLSGTRWEPATVDEGAKSRALRLKRKLPPGVDILVV